jgi:HupE / UreJ protein
VGLPQTAIPVALLMFNVGVEVGQLAFVACMLGARTVLARLPTTLPEWSLRLPPYAIGTVAMYWVIERIGAFWS